MSEENVEIVRRSHEVLNRDGLDAAFNDGLLSPELVFDASETGIPGLGVYRGRDEGFATFPFAEWEVQLDRLVDHGDRVVGISRQRGRGAAQPELVDIFTLRDGQIVRIELHRDRAKALEAAGLSE